VLLNDVFIIFAQCVANLLLFHSVTYLEKVYEVQVLSFSMVGRERNSIGNYPFTTDCLSKEKYKIDIKTVLTA
jgi:hypothetical protein